MTFIYFRTAEGGDIFGLWFSASKSRIHSRNTSVEDEHLYWKWPMSQSSWGHVAFNWSERCTCRRRDTKRPRPRCCIPTAPSAQGSCCTYQCKDRGWLGEKLKKGKLAYALGSVGKWSLVFFLFNKNKIIYVCSVQANLNSDLRPPFATTGKEILSFSSVFATYCTVYCHRRWGSHRRRVLPCRDERTGSFHCNVGQTIKY